MGLIKGYTRTLDHSSNTSLPPYRSLLAAGDAERELHLLTHGSSPQLIRQICFPAHWSLGFGPVPLTGDIGVK